MTDASTTDSTQDEAPSAEDLALLPESLDDEGKTDDEIEDEIWATEDAAANGKATDTSVVTDKDSDATAQSAADSESLDDHEDEPLPKDDDIWAEASPAQKAAFEAQGKENVKLDLDNRSVRGRLSSMQKQVNDVTTQFDRLHAEKPVGDDKPGDEGTKKGEKFNAMAGEYPEIADGVDERMTAMEKRQDAGDKDAKDAKNRREIAANDAVDEQIVLLTEKHSDWREIANDEVFQNWVDDQPRADRNIAARNAPSIVDASETADLMSRFKAARLEQSSDSAGSQIDKSSGKTLTSSTGKRRRQLESSASARPQGQAAANAGIPEDGDEDDLWDAIDQKEARQRRA